MWLGNVLPHPIAVISEVQLAIPYLCGHWLQVTIDLSIALEVFPRHIHTKA